MRIMLMTAAKMKSTMRRMMEGAFTGSPCLHELAVLLGRRLRRYAQISPYQYNGRRGRPPANGNNNSSGSVTGGCASGTWVVSRYLVPTLGVGTPCRDAPRPVLPPAPPAGAARHDAERPGRGFPRRAWEPATPSQREDAHP